MLSIWGKSATPAHSRYVIRTLAFMAGYVAINVALMTGAIEVPEEGVAGWLLAAAVTAPVIGQLWATLSLMSESDEFVRALTAKQFILSTFLTMAIATFWGFGESFAQAPHLPAWLVYPLFSACFGLVAPFVRSSR